MAQLVYAGATSHTAQMVRSPEKLEASQRSRIYAALELMRVHLAESRPDLLVVFGGDHYQSFHLHNMPAFCIGMGHEAKTFGDAGVPQVRYATHGVFARFLASFVLDAGIDVATSRRLALDHAFASPLHFVTPNCELPLVPIVINSIAAPLAPPVRSHLLGRWVADAITSFPDDLRIAVLGTGGLSHWVPIPDADQPSSGPDAELVEEMIAGNADSGRMSRLLLPRIARLSEANNARIAEDFDREVIDLLAAGCAPELASRSTAWIEKSGGGGGQEIRNWLAVAGATGDSLARLIAYEPAVPWLTGIAMMEWDVAQNT